MSETSVKIDGLVNQFVGAVTSFNSEIGDINGKGLLNLYAQFNLSNPPLDAEVDAMSIKKQREYLALENEFVERSLDINDIQDKLVAIINPVTGQPFGNINALKVWVTDPDNGMGPVGVEIASNLTALISIHPKITSTCAVVIKARSGMLRDYTTEVNSQVDGKDGNIRT